MITTLITHLTLPGYCNHSHPRHDGQTLWLLVDTEPTVQLYRWNYYQSPPVWEMLWDLLRDYRDPATGQGWPEVWKPGLGHGLEIGPSNIIISVPYKHLTGGAPGCVVVALARSIVPPMQG